MANLTKWQSVRLQTRGFGQIRGFQSIENLKVSPAELRVDVQAIQNEDSLLTDAHIRRKKE